MKIFIICPFLGYPGGRGQYLFSVVEELIKRGHRVTLLYEKLKPSPMLSKYSSEINLYQIPFLTSFRNPGDKRSVVTLSLILSAESPDTVFFSDIKNYALLSGLINYGKLVAMAHHGWLFCLRDTRTLYMSRNACYRKLGVGCLLFGCFLKKATSGNGFPLQYSSLSDCKKLISVYKKIDLHLVASQYMKDLFIQHGFKDKQVTIIKLFTEFPELSFRMENISQEPNILFLGRIDRYKGVDYLLRALSKIHSEFSCTIIGDGFYLPYCKKLAKNLNLETKVKFLGWLAKEETIQYLEKALIVVVPSLVPEAFGLVGIEAMSYGKVVVAFNNGGISDWLQNGKTGYLIAPKDTVTLANKLDYLLNNPDIASEMGRAGRAYAERNYSKEAHFVSLFKIFEKASKEISTRKMGLDENHTTK